VLLAIALTVSLVVPTTACAGRSGSPNSDEATDPASTSRPWLVNGTYTFSVSEEDLLAAGVTNAADLQSNTGTFTFEFADGKWVSHQETPVLLDPDSYDQSGSYTLIGDRLTVYFSQLHRDNRMSADVVIGGDGSLRLTNFEDPWGVNISRGVFGNEPWVRVNN
jgi:hypothetical protein